MPREIEHLSVVNSELRKEWQQKLKGEEAMRLGYESRAGKILSKMDNILWEHRLHISTRGVSEDEDDQPERHCYSTVPYRAIFRILVFLSLKNSDVFVDLGCGKGRAICCAATYDLAEVVGVEYREDLCGLARLNVRQLRNRRAPVSIISGRAEDFDFTRGTIFYLFNPFGPTTMSELLDKLRSGLNVHDREIRIAYLNPVHEELLAGTSWLRRYATLPDPGLREFNATSFWVSR
jgi:SAM-dependent methyltransferase